MCTCCPPCTPAPPHRHAAARMLGWASSGSPNQHRATTLAHRLLVYNCCPSCTPAPLHAHAAACMPGLERRPQTTPRDHPSSQAVYMHATAAPHAHRVPLHTPAAACMPGSSGGPEQPSPTPLLPARRRRGSPSRRPPAGASSRASSRCSSTPVLARLWPCRCASRSRLCATGTPPAVRMTSDAAVEAGCTCQLGLLHRWSGHAPFHCNRQLDVCL